MSNTTFPTIVLGDLHGRRDLLVKALLDLGLIDKSLSWIGGARRLVQVGDVVDRGPEPLAALDLLMRLQAEARAAGGEITCLVGNHELLALEAGAGLHRSRMSWAYNGCGANYLEWLGRRGESGDELAIPYPEAFYAEFGPDSVYGRWIRSHKLACRVGDYVAVHAGWTPEGPDSVEEANRLFAADPLETRATLGLLWSRNQPEDEIRDACQRLGCRGLIAGHTPLMGILTSAGGRLIQIDIGMYFFGQWAALGLDETGRLWALMDGEEPHLIEGDGMVPLPAAREFRREEPAPQRHGPGDLIRLYRATDGSYAEYFLIRRSEEFKSYPGYAGRLFTYDARQGWSFKEFLWPSDRVDRFGQPADAGEVPEEMLG